jgi:16S rRNA (adenine1518-N6/adenine1519-N6)-dimethyltransferase
MSAADHPKAQLQQARLVAKRHFGQNFLSDATICRRIADECTPQGTRTVVEIGAGLGALTRSLLEQSEQVVAIERDRDLVPELSRNFAGPIEEGRLTVVEDDAKNFDYVAAFSARPRPATLVGNLPYQLTGPLLRRSLEVSALVERCTYLVQLEVADRLTAKPGTDSYGALTVFLQARFETRRRFVVRRGAFFPQPNVDSALVVLTPIARPLAEETPLFRALVKAAFAQRRKKLRNAWAKLQGLSNSDLLRAAELSEIDLDLRGETLSVEQFAKMTTIASQFAHTEGE